jgi:hypothetical protein
MGIGDWHFWYRVFLVSVYGVQTFERHIVLCIYHQGDFEADGKERE